MSFSPSSTIHELANALQQGSTNSAALTATALDRIQAPEGEGDRVFTRVFANTARAAAQASDTLREAGLRRSAIDGLPISVKDLFDIAGYVTQAGSIARTNANANAATTDALVVQRLRQAGAVIVGSTNMTEFAYSGLGLNPHYGTPRNPWDRATGRIPGGSSSGAAVSVCDGMAVAGIGSDTGGSIRIPAALCGLTGFKPTASRIPTQGTLPLSSSLDSIGSIAPSVRCCAQLDRILAGLTAAELQPAMLQGLRLALPTTVALDGMDAHVAHSFQAALSQLRAAGVCIQEIPIPAFAELAHINAKGGLIAAQAWHWHQTLIGQAGHHYDPRVISRILRGKAMSAADYLDVLEARSRWIADVTTTLAPFDAMLMPTVPIVAPTIAELESDDDRYFQTNALMLRNPSIINFLDGCALSIPCHAAGSAPVGLMLASTALQDQRVLAIGLALEGVLRKHKD